MPHPTLVAGQQLAGRYRIVGVIGSGGYGAVYEAEPLSGGLRVALKVLHGAVGADDVERKRFRREAELMQALAHPHVVGVLEAGEAADGVPYIALELLRGRTLREELKRAGPRAADWVAEVGRQVLHALDAAHRRGMIHRDLKPHNLFLCDRGPTDPYLKVLDFGIAKLVGAGEDAHTRLTETGVMIGTPHYMAPEQVLGHDIGPAADLYALGLILAEAIAGARIMQGSDPFDILLAQASDHPVSLPDAVTHSPLGPVVTRAVQKRLAARYPSAAAMRADLDSRLPAPPQPTVAWPAHPPPVSTQHVAATTAHVGPAPLAAPATLGPTQLAYPSAPAPVDLRADPASSGRPARLPAVLVAVLSLIVVALLSAFAAVFWLGTEQPVAKRRPPSSTPARKTTSRAAQQASLSKLTSKRLNQLLDDNGWRVVEMSYGGDGTYVDIHSQNATRGKDLCGVSVLTYGDAADATAGARAMVPSPQLAIHVEGRRVLTVKCQPGDAQALMRVIRQNLK